MVAFSLNRFRWYNLARMPWTFCANSDRLCTSLASFFRLWWERLTRATREGRGEPCRSSCGNICSQPLYWHMAVKYSFLRVKHTRIEQNTTNVAQQVTITPTGLRYGQAGTNGCGAGQGVYGTNLFSARSIRSPWRFLCASMYSCCGIFDGSLRP